MEIARPPDAVWAFVADVDRIPEWIGEFEEAHEQGPPLSWAGGGARPRGSALWDRAIATASAAARGSSAERSPSSPTAAPDGGR